MMQTRRLLSLVCGVALAGVAACSQHEADREQESQTETNPSQVQTTPVDSAVQGIDIPAAGPLDSLPDPEGRVADTTAPAGQGQPR